MDEQQRPEAPPTEEGEEERPREPEAQEEGRGSGWRVVVVAVFVVLLGALAFGIRIYDDYARGADTAKKGAGMSEEVEEACEKARLALLEPNGNLSNEERVRLQSAIKANCE